MPAEVGGSRKLALVRPAQARELEVQFSRVRTELLELQRQLEAAGVTPTGGWRASRAGIGECDVVCDAECGIVCYQGCPEDCDDQPDPCVDDERLRGPDIVEQILLSRVMVGGILVSPKRVARSALE